MGKPLENHGDLWFLWKFEMRSMALILFSFSFSDVFFPGGRALMFGKRNVVQWQIHMVGRLFTSIIQAGFRGQKSTKKNSVAFALVYIVGV